MRLLSTLSFTALCLATTLASQTTVFESPQTQPLAISPDGLRLLVTNTPDHRVAFFTLANPSSPVLLGEVTVGMEPVACAFRTNSEAWVVNHLSDSISVVDLDEGVVVDTIQVGDEPSAIVFANGRAFVSIATRREVSVFDAATRAHLTDIDVFGDEPRWTVASANGSKVFVATHKSGNETTVIPFDIAPPPPPPTNPALPAPPQVGKIVHSEDAAFSGLHDIDLPDYDVFEIDTSSLAITRRHAALGTILFGMDVDPTNGDLWIANTEALNLIEFEPELRGHMVDHRLTKLTLGGTPTANAFDLNPGIDYAVLPNPAAIATALAQPTDVKFSPSGSELFVAAFGSDRVGVVDPSTGTVLSRIDIGDAASARTKRGPRGLAHHPSAQVLYVLNRLSNTLSTVDTATRTELRETSLVFDPTPADVKEGRGFMYDTKLSGNGTASCAVCHIDSTTDNLGWDLGDRGGDMLTVPGPINSVFHPMKGPMTTQSLVGIDGQTPFHWRGDREDLAAFNPAFDKLLGGSEISASDMDALETFVHAIKYPPNPNQNRDRTLAPDAEDGRILFESVPFNGFLRCVNCHSIDTGTNNAIIPGAVLQETQDFKVPHLRNLYKRDGRRDVNGQRTAGFGQLHDGSDDDVFDLLSAPVFGPLATNTNDKTKLMAFVESFDTGLAPAVGFSRTFHIGNHTDTGAIADRALLMLQAQNLACDLVVRGSVDGESVGLLYSRSTQQFVQNGAGLPELSTTDLDSLFAQDRAKLTFLGVPLGEGPRIGIDRDGDGTLDRDEGLSTYGAPTPGCDHEIHISSPAFRGNDLFGFSATGATPGSNGALFLGFGSASIPFLGIDVLVDPNGLITVATSADARGVAAIPMELGDDPGLQNVNLFVQMVFLDACGTFGLAATDALQVTIQ